MKIAKLIFKYLYLILILYIIYNLSKNYKDLSIFFQNKILINGGITFIVFSILYIGFLKNSLHFWEIFFHELTHTFFAILTFNKIEHFSVTKGQGGLTGYTGSTNWLISLSPYFFPIHTILLLVLKLFIDKKFYFYYDYLIFVSYSFFIITVFKQFRLHQPDIKNTGYLYSILMIISKNILFLIFFAALISGKTHIFFSLLKKIFPIS